MLIARLKRIGRHLTYANVMVTLLGFIVLAGGTAWALDGSNTVFSDDIVNGEVQTQDLGDAQVTARKLAPDSVDAAKVLDNSLGPADLEHVGFLQAKTQRLNSGQGEPLFTVGRVRLFSNCFTGSDGTTTGYIGPGVDEIGPLMVTEDQLVQLQPFDVEFLVIAGSDSAIDAAQTSYALIDRNGTSVTGVAAVSVDPATDRCVVSISAIG